MRAQSWWIAIVLGISAGGVFFFALLRSTSPEVATEQERPPDSAQPQNATVIAEAHALPAVISPVQAAAERYIAAVQEGRCSEIIALTAWMAKRLEYVQTASSDPAEHEAARERLCDQITTRTVEGNQLRAEGVEDQYVFAPTTQVEWIYEDEGRSDLDAAVAGRAWFRIVYQNPDLALRDESGRAICRVTVGVNVSPEGVVVKAGVVGNVEMDLESVSLDWTSKETNHAAGKMRTMP